MKAVIPDSKILEIPGKILRFLARFLQIRKAIDTNPNHVEPLELSVYSRVILRCQNMPNKLIGFVLSSSWF